MKRAAILLVAVTWAVLAGSAMAASSGGRQGGGGRDEREERRQPQQAAPQDPRGSQRSDPGNRRMSPEEAQRLREQIRQHNNQYRDRECRP